MSTIELRHVSRWYGNVVAVNDVSCSIDSGITGVLGPNGAGKTTVLHMIAGLLAPSTGEVLVGGKRAFGAPDIYRTLALVPEREAVHAFLTGWEFVRMSARLQGVRDADAAARRALELVDLDAVRNRKIGGYSKGMRQRVKIAGALVHDPEILVLDEPFAGMDPRQRLHMIEVLRGLAAGGRTIVLSSHILEELHELATTVLVMVAGRLAASGHFREIRRLMTDRPHTFLVRTSDDRSFAAAIMRDASVFGVELTQAGLVIHTSDRGALTRRIASTARGTGVGLREVRPTDESLESVFAYLVER